MYWTPMRTWMYWTPVRGENLDVLYYENLDVLDPYERGEPGCIGPL